MLSVFLVVVGRCMCIRYLLFDIEYYMVVIDIYVLSIGY